MTPIPIGLKNIFKPEPFFETKKELWNFQVEPKSLKSANRQTFSSRLKRHMVVISHFGTFKNWKIFASTDPNSYCCLQRKGFKKKY